MSKYDISPGTAIDLFEDISGFTVTNGTPSLDASFYQQGNYSLKLITDSGAVCSAVKTVNLDLSGASNVVIWFYLPTVTGVSSIQIALSNDSGFSNYFTTNVQYHEYWNKIIIPKSLWGTSGSPSWSSAVTRIRIRITALSEQTVAAYFDSMYYQENSKPKVIVSFDDGWDDVYLDAYPYMRKLGIPGVNFIISSLIDQSGRLTLSQLREMYNSGWDVCNHTKTHVNLETGLSTQSEVETELTECKDFIISNTLSRLKSELHVAYPQGGYDQKTLAAMTATGMLTGRLTVNRIQANVIDSPYLLTRRSHDYTANQATYRGWVDQLIEGGGCLQINYHQIVADGTASAGTQVERTQFRDMMDYLNANRARIDIVTMTEWYRGINESRRLS